MHVLGIDIGGSAVKGAIVDTQQGCFTKERIKIELTNGASVSAINQAVAEIVTQFQWDGLIGCGFPAVVKNGVVHTAANIDENFIGLNVEELFSTTTGRRVKVYNDADAAGFAELKFGHIKDFKGFVIFLTVGTGIGSALFYNGQLISNTELGHVFMKNGIKGEKFTSDAIREKLDLTWDKWGVRFNKYLEYLQSLFYPDLFIIGGGTSKKFEKFSHKLTVATHVVPAKLLNDAGIIGAATLAFMENQTFTD
ncbi:MAG TPA: ROK family protein [Salinivirgaceae bacterium]|nr:ROK family protein [Salinivirgaceae bacterium]